MKGKFIFRAGGMAGYAIIFISIFLHAGCSTVPIDRYSLVTRHNIVNTSKDSLNSLSVGNGDFAFTADFTGLQTFPEKYERGVPLGTMSNWGWHTSPNPENYSLSDVYKTYNVHGKGTDYVQQFRATDGERKYRASEWLRENPHRIHLGLIGLRILHEDGSETKIEDFSNPVQKLNLWTGELESRFMVDGDSVSVFTLCHPSYDMISARVVSGMIMKKRLAVTIRFPYGAPVSFGSDIDAPGEHSSEILSDTNNITIFGRRQYNDSYNVLLWRNNAKVSRTGDHSFLIEPPDSGKEYSFSCHFYNNGEGRIQTFGEAREASVKEWESFWISGGAIDFSACTDPRAAELERRVILSRYLTKIQCSGSMPPAETGLTYNSWYGKFHLEMHWWHSAHFPLWQKGEILEKQMEYYNTIFNNAAKTAEHQGYKGVRWPKMVGPDGRESPSNVGTFLIWQQPHIIFFAEQLYKDAQDKKAVLGKYRELVFVTADFMASYAWYDSTGNRYCLGPVLIPAQESLSLQTTVNPSFELVYWRWALNVACKWRSRLNMDPDPLWKDVAEKIAVLPVQNGVYLCSEDTKDTWVNPRYMRDHPIIAGTLGVLPETGLVDKKILRNSLDTISRKWNWQSTWGWDFPMLAMSAASVGRPDQAIDFLLMDARKNRYLISGHNYQDPRLSIYLPGNGGLLTTVAMMSTGNLFPHDGKWKVKWENLNSYPK